MSITVKKPTFEPEVRNSIENLQTRYAWFMEWRDSDLDFTRNCIFIDEAGFHRCKLDKRNEDKYGINMTLYPPLWYLHM
jgi:hypothetical protein